MRFSVVALFAAAASASVVGEQSTVYETSMRTITSCGPEVPDCPYNGHASTPVAETPAETPIAPPVETPVYPVVSAAPSNYVNASEPVVDVTNNSPVDSPEKEEGDAACPAVSIKTIHTSYTTVLPTVLYETMEVPCTTEATPSPVASTASPSNPAVTEPVFTGGAATKGASLLAVGAGLVALLA